MFEELKSGEENITRKNLKLKKTPPQSNTSLTLQKEDLVSKIRLSITREWTVPITTLDFYKISSLLGEGSYGKVYLGKSVLTGFPVALKCYDW